MFDMAMVVAVEAKVGVAVGRGVGGRRKGMGKREAVYPRGEVWSAPPPRGRFATPSADCCDWRLNETVAVARSERRWTS